MGDIVPKCHIVYRYEYRRRAYFHVFQESPGLNQKWANFARGNFLVASFWLKLARLDEDGATACTACPVGRFSPSAVVACESCPPGSITDTLDGGGATLCQECAPGTFSESPDTACEPCSLGSTTDTLSAPGAQHNGTHWDASELCRGRGMNGKMCVGTSTCFICTS